MRIGKILDTRGALYQCKDGTFSTSNGRGACVFHGGLKSNIAIYANRECFAEGLQKDLLLPQKAIVKTNKIEKVKITDEELIFLALNIQCDNDLLSGLVYFLQKKYPKMNKDKLIERIYIYVQGVDVGTRGGSATLKKYILRDEFTTQYPHLKALSDEKLNDCLNKIKEANGIVYVNFDWRNKVVAQTFFNPIVTKIAPQTVTPSQIRDKEGKVQPIQKHEVIYKRDGLIAITKDVESFYLEVKKMEFLKIGRVEYHLKGKRKIIVVKTNGIYAITTDINGEKEHTYIIDEDFEPYRNTKLNYFVSKITQQNNEASDRGLFNSIGSIKKYGSF